MTAKMASTGSLLWRVQYDSEERKHAQSIAIDTASCSDNNNESNKVLDVSKDKVVDIISYIDTIDYQINLLRQVVKESNNGHQALIIIILIIVR